MGSITPNVVMEGLIGEQEALEILRWQGVGQGGLAVCQGDRETAFSGVGGLVVNLVTSQGPVFLTTFDETAQGGFGIQPTADFFCPDFEVSFLAALKNSSLACLCASSCFRSSSKLSRG